MTQHVRLAFPDGRAEKLCSGRILIRCSSDTPMLGLAIDELRRRAKSCEMAEACQSFAACSDQRLRANFHEVHSNPCHVVVNECLLRRRWAAKRTRAGFACSTSATRTPTGDGRTRSFWVKSSPSSEREIGKPLTRDRIRADVVVLDWSQSDIEHPQVREPGGYESHLKSPLGERARWGTRRSFGQCGALARRALEDLRGQRVNLLEPYAYVLRVHPVFDAPIAIDRDQLIAKPWPEDWTEPHAGKTIQVLPLILPDKHPRMPGWCTYTRDMTAAPEIEVFCGGINSKTATAAALWRQGNLLVYGFDLAPDEMNEWAAAFLVNAITYIARFTDDRPIMETPSPSPGGSSSPETASRC